MEAVVRYAPISMVPTPAPAEEATCSTQMERHAQVGVTPIIWKQQLYCKSLKYGVNII